MAKKNEVNTNQDTLQIASIMDAHEAMRDTLHAHVFKGRNSVALTDVIRALCVNFSKHECGDIAKRARAALRKKYKTYATNEAHRHEFCTPDNAALFDTYVDCVLVATRKYTRDENALKNAII